MAMLALVGRSLYKLANKLAFKALPPTLSLRAYFVLELKASVIPYPFRVVGFVPAVT